MIVGFRHKGLKLLYEKGDRRRVSPEPANMDLPGYRLHPLKGDLAGYWSVSVSGNWRIIFRFDGVHACDVDLIDYH